MPTEQSRTAQDNTGTEERGDRRPTLKTIARLTGLGITTVDKLQTIAEPRFHRRT